MKKIHNLKLFGLVAILTVALVFIGIDFIEGQVKTQGKPPNPPGQDKPDKPGKSKTEWIEFTGDLFGGQAVDGCCPNAGPFPEYKMWLAPEVDGSESGEWHDGYLFMNVLGGRRTDGQYIVQFGTGDCEVAIEIRGGVIDYDKKNKVLTVTFEDDLCMDRCTNRIITEVTFTLVRRPY